MIKRSHSLTALLMALAIRSTAHASNWYSIDCEQGKSKFSATLEVLQTRAVAAWTLYRKGATEPLYSERLVGPIKSKVGTPQYVSFDGDQLLEYLGIEHRIMIVYLVGENAVACASRGGPRGSK